MVNGLRILCSASPNHRAWLQARVADAALNLLAWPLTVVRPVNVHVSGCVVWAI